MRNGDDKVSDIRSTQGGPTLHKPGQLPSYLKKKKQTENFEREHTLKEIENNKKPSDCIVLDESERKSTLEELLRQKKKLQSEIDSMPISQYTKRA